MNIYRNIPVYDLTIEFLYFNKPLIKITLAGEIIIDYF